MNSKLKKIIEQRTLEAAQKKIPEKLHRILNVLGEPIIAQGYDQEFLHDIYDEELTIPEIDEDTVTYELGKFYSDLRSGTNLEIKYDTFLKELKVSYNGYIVFHEDEGRLLGYAPFSEWENRIDSLDIIAQKKDNERRSRKKIEEIEVSLGNLTRR
jgi:hypothetical protein